MNQGAYEPGYDNAKQEVPAGQDVLRGEVEHRSYMAQVAQAAANSRIRLIGEPGPFFEDFAKAQSEFQAVKKDAKADLGQYGYSYAPLENLLAATLPAMNKHGLSLLQPFAGKPGGGHELQTWICHRSGARLVMETDIPKSDKIQQLGSAITYLRRYTVQAVLGINGEDDDDGNQADGNRAQIQRAEKPRAPQPSAAPPARPVQQPAAKPEVKTVGGPAPAMPANPPAPQATISSHGDDRAEAAGTIQAAPTNETVPMMTGEQSEEIADLFKRLGVKKLAALDTVKQVTGKDGPFAMTTADATKLIAHLKAKVEAPSTGAAS